VTCPQCARARRAVASVEVSPFPCDRCGGLMTGSGWECINCVNAARAVFGPGVRPIGGGGVLSGC
jgi:ribosomal protein L37AE/L43A